MPTAPDPYASLASRLLTLQRQSVAADARHARRPYVLGPADAAERYWVAGYEARAALAELNPAVASALLPRLALVALLGPGLPLVPAGVYARVDAPDAPAGTITLRVAVAGGLALRVTLPDGRTFAPPVVATASYSQAVFGAVSDGLYGVAVEVGGQVLANLYVVVQRAEYRRFRENSRELDFQFRPAPFTPSPAYRKRLALIICKEAAARTGQLALFHRLDAAAKAVPQAPTPIHRYPYV